MANISSRIFPTLSVSRNSGIWPTGFVNGTGTVYGTGVYATGGTGVMPMVSRTFAVAQASITGGANAESAGGAVAALVVLIGFMAILV